MNFLEKQPPIEKQSSSLVRQIAIELVRFCILVGLMLGALLVLFEAIFIDQSGSDPQELLQVEHLEEIWVDFYLALCETLPIILWAAFFLVVFSLLFTSILVAWPRFQIFKQAILLVSAMPAFTLPFLYYVAFPTETFRGFVFEVDHWLLGLLLAIGDLNLITFITVLTEVANRESKRPHLKLVRLLNQNPANVLWPQMVVSLIAALASRIPYLLGSTITLEILFEIHGLGILVLQAITDTPPRYTVLLCVCGFGVGVTQLLSFLSRISELILLPHHRKSVMSPFPESDKSNVRDARTEPDHNFVTGSGEDDVKIRTEVSSQKRESTIQVPEMRVFLSTTERYFPGKSVLTRCRFYLKSRPWNRVNAFLAVCLVAMGCGVLMWGIFTQSSPKAQAAGLSFASPEQVWPFGTDDKGDDVLGLVLHGFAQQIPPIALSLLIVIFLSVTAAVARPVIDYWDTNLRRRIPNLYSLIVSFLCEFIESLPKLVILLAAITYFEAMAILYKLYLVIGVLFVPQMYRALRDELLPLRQAAYWEAMQTLQVPWLSVLWHNMFRNHVLHVVILQSTLIIGSIIHVDALLGFASVDKPSGVYTLGSVLGKGADLYLQNKPVADWYPFNNWVFIAPLIAVWLLCVVLYTLADVFKILTGGYLYHRY